MPGENHPVGTIADRGDNLGPCYRWSAARRFQFFALASEIPKRDAPVSHGNPERSCQPMDCRYWLSPSLYTPAGRGASRALRGAAFFVPYRQSKNLSKKINESRGTECHRHPPLGNPKMKIHRYFPTRKTQAQLSWHWCSYQLSKPQPIQSLRRRETCQQS